MDHYLTEKYVSLETEDDRNTAEVIESGADNFADDVIEVVGEESEPSGQDDNKNKARSKKDRENKLEKNSVFFTFMHSQY